MSDFEQRHLERKGFTIKEAAWHSDIEMWMQCVPLAQKTVQSEMEDALGDQPVRW